jgi:hypothetical protein
MSKKIAAVDNEAMNGLFAAEMQKAAATVGVRDQNGAPKDEVAFADHEEYLATLENVMADDKKNSFEPNDTVQD